MKQDITIEKIIENHLLYKDIKKLKGEKIGPSEISSSCARKVVLDRSPEAVAAAETPTLRGISVMLAGTAIHEYFQDKVFKENGSIEIIEAEKYIFSEYINGYIDGIIRFAGENKLALLEIKSVNQVKYDKMKSSKKPLIEYVEQLTLYEGESGIHEGYIFIVNRGLFERETPMTRALKPTDSISDDMFLVFKVDFNDVLYNSLVERAKGLIRALSDYKEYGLIPDKPGMCTPNGFPCLWCRFKHYCWPEMYREVPMRELDPSTRAELTKLFTDHMSNKLKAQTLNLKLEASEKALARFFRDNGMKGFSSVRGDNYVIGTDGSVYIENIDINKKVVVAAGDVQQVKQNVIAMSSETSDELVSVKTIEKDEKTKMAALEESKIADVIAIDINSGETVKRKRGRPKKKK